MQLRALVPCTTSWFHARHRLASRSNLLAIAICPFLPSFFAGLIYPAQILIALRSRSLLANLFRGHYPLACFRSGMTIACMIFVFSNMQLLSKYSIFIEKNFLDDVMLSLESDLLQRHAIFFAKFSLFPGDVSCF